MMTTSFPRPSSRSALLTLALAACLLTSCQNGASDKAPDKAASEPAQRPGAPVSAAKVDTGFQLPAVDGRTLGPKSFPGQVVVVDFWATWCMPCRIQAQILEPIYQQYKGRGVQFLAADWGEEPAEVKKFLKEKPFPYPVLLDSDQAVGTKLRLTALPTLMVIGKKGEVVYFESGLADADSLHEILRRAGA
jgi:thiol-disulfide isomerase/thioredoxin